MKRFDNGPVQKVELLATKTLPSNQSHKHNRKSDKTKYSGTDQAVQHGGCPLDIQLYQLPLRPKHTTSKTDTVHTFRADLAGVPPQLILVEARVTAGWGGGVGQAVMTLRAQVSVWVGDRLARWAVVACTAKEYFASVRKSQSAGSGSASHWSVWSWARSHPATNIIISVCSLSQTTAGSHTYKYTRMHTHRCMYTHTCMHTDTNMYAFAHAHTNAHSLKHTHTHPNMHALAHTNAHSLTHTHTHTQPHWILTDIARSRDTAEPHAITIGTAITVRALSL